MAAIHELPRVFLAVGSLKGEASEPVGVHKCVGNCVGVVEEAHCDRRAMARAVPT